MSRPSVVPLAASTRFADQLGKIERHFGYHVADRPYTCMLIIPQRWVSSEILNKCYVVYVDDSRKAFAAQVELVRLEGQEVELYFSAFLPFVQDGGGRIETVGTHLVLQSFIQLLPFSPGADCHRGTRRPPGLPV